MEKNSFYQLLDNFFIDFPQYTKDEQKNIIHAWRYLCDTTNNMYRFETEPYVLHPLRVATILAQSNLDANTIIAGFLHNILSLEHIDNNKIQIEFGTDVLNIITSAHRITALHIQSKTLQEADSFRKMLFAMINDVRVILVKLADRLDHMRYLKSMPFEKQKSIAREVIEIWAPLANRFGMSAVKIEMEDLSLKFTNPDVFAQLKQLVSAKKEERTAYIEKAQKEIYKAATKAGIEITAYGRAKHFYSIYQKLRKKNRTVDELLDLLAIRVLCNEVQDCYVMIGLVHKLWKPLDGRFKDYIAMPKANGYQSIHTTVMCGAKPLEIQIRTHEMHSIAEHGIASHWLYKKGFSKDTAVSIENLGIINQLKELKDNNLNDDMLFNEIKEELLGDSIFVFTPKGEVRELPAGATAIDFAYSIHTRIGQTIVGAKANGQIIPLSKPLKNTEIIEILTSPQASPKITQLEWVKTSRARSKIRAWLSAHDPYFAPEKPLTKEEKEQTELQKQTQQELALQKKQKKIEAQKNNNTEVNIRIAEGENFLLSRAKCCNPSYGEPIVGYVSRGRGIILHRADCPNLKHIPHVEQRLVQADWDTIEIPRQDQSSKKKKKPSAKNSSTR